MDDTTIHRREGFSVEIYGGASTARKSESVPAVVDCNEKTATMEFSIVKTAPGLRTPQFPSLTKVNEAIYIYISMILMIWLFWSI